MCYGPAIFSNFMLMNFIVSAIIGVRLVSFFPAFAQSAEPLYSISSNVHRSVIAVLIVFASVSLCLYAPNIALFNMLIPAVELSPKLLKGSQIWLEFIHLLLLLDTVLTHADGASSGSW